MIPSPTFTQVEPRRRLSLEVRDSASTASPIRHRPSSPDKPTNPEFNVPINPHLLTALTAQSAAIAHDINEFLKGLENKTNEITKNTLKSVEVHSKVVGEYCSNVLGAVDLLNCSMEVGEAETGVEILQEKLEEVRRLNSVLAVVEASLSK